MQASEVVGKLRDELKSGKPVAEAASEVGVKVEKIPTFALVDTLPGHTLTHTRAERRNPRPAPHQASRKRLESRRVSDYMSTPMAAPIVILEKRETLDPAEVRKSRVLIWRSRL